MSFFQSDEKIPLNQKSLTFNSSNGLSYQEGNKIIIEIPPETCEFFDPSQSYLNFDVKINTNTPTKNYLIQLDSYLGAQVLLRDIRAYNLQGVLLEEMVNVNVLSNIMCQYSDTKNNQNKHGLTTGEVLHNPEQRTWAAKDTRVEKSRETNTQYNPYFTKDATGNATFNTVPICLKLPLGIMQSKRIWANGIFGGLRLEIILEDKEKCLKLFRNASPGAMANANEPDAVSSYYLPVLDHVGANKQASGFAKAAGKQTQIFLGWKNNQCATQYRCPFCVGEVVNIADTAAGKVSGTITSIDWIDIGAGVEQIRLTVDSMAAPVNADIAAGTVVYSTGFIERVNDPDYTVSNVNMVIQQVMPEASYISAMEKAMKENGGLVYDCHCWQNYRHSVASSEVTTTANLNILQRMAKALMIAPVSPTSLALADSVKEYGGHRTGISGIMDTVEEFQFYYSEKFQPNESIGTDKVQSALDIYNAEYLAELTKCLAFFGVPPSHTLLNIKTNMVYPRALALMNQVVNLTEGDFQAIVTYTNPTAAKLFNCWVAGVRRFKATPEGVVVTY